MIDWEPESSDTPNAEWLTATFAYFAKVPRSHKHRS